MFKNLFQIQKMMDIKLNYDLQLFLIGFILILIKLIIIKFLKKSYDFSFIKVSIFPIFNHFKMMSFQVRIISSFKLL